MSATSMQDVAALVLVLGAASYLIWSGWRAVARARARRVGGCGPGCGCD
ncbi:MAG: FeoB-associated Cys-rich membrane protein [Gemmatimonadales bacterium]